MTSLKTFLALLLASLPALADLDLRAPNPEFPPVNQLKVSGNACGPAALLNAFGFGDKKWQEVYRTVPGSTDKLRLLYVIRGHGLKPSRHLDQLRWTKSRGVSLLDLTDMGNEMRGSRWISKLSHQLFIRERREQDHELIKRIHSRLARSMQKGLPPIASLQRVAHPSNRDATAIDWRLVHGHFIVITALPDKLERKATSFSFQYVDPWGGKFHEGTVSIDPSSTYPAAVATVPKSDIGKRYLKSGETSLVTFAGALGAF